MAKYCANCGSKLADDDLFCGVCGTKQESLKEAVMPISLPEEKPAVQITITAPVMTVEEAKEPEKPKKRKKKVLIIILCILLPLCAAAAAFFFFGGAELFSGPKGLIAADEIEEKLNEIYIQLEGETFDFYGVYGFTIEDVDEESHDQEFHCQLSENISISGNVKNGRVDHINATLIGPKIAYDSLTLGGKKEIHAVMAGLVGIIKPEIDTVPEILKFLDDMDDPYGLGEGKMLELIEGEVKYSHTIGSTDDVIAILFSVTYWPAFPDDSDEGTTGTMEKAERSSSEEVPSNNSQSSSPSPIAAKVDSASKEEAPHSHAFGAWKDETADLHARSCSCGEKETAAHTFDGGTVTLEPTEESAGVKTYTCTVCGDTQTESIPQLPHTHNFSGWSDDYNGYTHSSYCSCGETETEDHSFDSGTVTIEPTCSSEGEMTYSCYVCGATLVESIPPKKVPSESEQPEYWDTSHPQDCYYCGYENGPIDLRLYLHEEVDISFTCGACGKYNRRTVTWTA